jgi:endonuclease G
MRFERDVARAIERLDFDLEALVAERRGKPPADFASAEMRERRAAFLRASLSEELDPASSFERVLAGNELQPASYLQRGAIAARAIARIAVRGVGGEQQGWGSGFLIAPRVLLTNNHVLESAEVARTSRAEFEYELDVADAPRGPIPFRLRPDELFITSGPLDFTAVAIEPRSLDGARSLASFGWLPLLPDQGKAFDGEWLTIVQHPQGERKQVCVRENQLLKRTTDVLWYTTDTQPGSSGSPVFNNDWFVVALHHSGVPEIKNGRWQTVDGRDWDKATMRADQIKWLANEGIRASRIAKTLRERLPSHALLQPMFASTPASARIRREPGSAAPNVPQSPSPEDRSMSDARTVTVTFRIETDGSITPIGSAESAAIASEAKPAAKKAKYDLPFDDDYAKRKGYDANFLGAGAKSVPLPELSPALKAVAQKRLDKPASAELDYHNFTVVMHAERRFAIYSAANVSFAGRFELSRPDDVWRVDPRIPSKVQIQNWYYASNKFDRGHLTRREDLEYGKSWQAALHSAADTCHWTNATPMHERFNQGKQIWQGIERHVLEEAIESGSFDAQVITGPVLEEVDPEYKGAKYPLRFWKVVAAIDEAGKLFATAYVASQEPTIDQHGIEAAVPFGPFKTYQVPIEEVERLTGLVFKGGNKSLRDFDPFPKRRPRRRPSASGAAEAAAVGAPPERYYELGSLDDIVR